ncbi:hypothetical protein J1605_013876 [Eschrichtius robustus]|uniref:Uncharacterized protein n=1 Tax=Eschrichtius robustus TaxID=9764 RepID=A0AB34GH15_ESCRO|nr:hypothetical protein J1605_013876 [Eschrichtius robustus]
MSQAVQIRASRRLGPSAQTGSVAVKIPPPWPHPAEFRSLADSRRSATPEARVAPSADLDPGQSGAAIGERRSEARSGRGRLPLGAPASRRVVPPALAAWAGQGLRFSAPPPLLRPGPARAPLSRPFPPLLPPPRPSSPPSPARP